MREVRQVQDAWYSDSGSLAPPYPVFFCGDCGERLGDAGEYDHANVADWKYCPWCGANL